LKPCTKRSDGHGVAFGSTGITFVPVEGKKIVVVMDEGKFNRLSLEQRAKIVWENGEFVDSVMYNQYCLMLYSVNRHFVELFLDLETHHIVWISLANEYDLAKYLQGVQIEV